MSTQSGTGPTTDTLALKGVQVQQSPEVNFLNEFDFRRFVFSGYSVILDTPLVKNNRAAIFAINVDGLVPPYNLGNNSRWSSLMKNFTPVQNFDTSHAYINILHEFQTLPASMAYFSNRFASGNVGVGLRLTSNTSQSGNFLISQASAVMRNYYAPDEQYTGLRFVNMSDNPTDYAIGAFSLGDASLNRNVSIVPIRRDPTRVTDFNWKINNLMTSAWDDYTEKFKQLFMSQFLEDWLLITPIGNLPSGTGNQVTFSIFFDYSKITWIVPLYVCITLPPNRRDRQILKVTDSLYANALVTPGNSIYLPGP